MESFNMDEDILVTSTSSAKADATRNNMTNNGISNLRVNETAIKKHVKNGKKLCIDKIKRILKVVGTLTLAGLMFVTGYVASKIQSDNELPPKLDNCVITEAKEYAYKGATISELAAKYYFGNDNELYEQYYGDFEKYQKTVLEANNRSVYFDKITEGTYVDIPIIFDMNNPFYKECVVLQRQIKEIEANNYWVSYTVKPGDSCSKLASLASSSEAETVELATRIMQHNGLETSNDLMIGTTIEIVNPELGTLKIQLEENKNNLYDYLQSTNQNEIDRQK